MATKDPLLEHATTLFRAAVKEQVLNHFKDKFGEEFASYQRSDAAADAYMQLPEDQREALQAYLGVKGGKRSELLADPKGTMEDAVKQSTTVKVTHFWHKGESGDTSKRPLNLIKYLADAYLKAQFKKTLLHSAEQNFISEIQSSTKVDFVEAVPTLRHDALPAKLQAAMFAEAFLAVPAIMKESCPATYRDYMVNPQSLTADGRGY